jgi:hypothetical protein
MMWSERVQHLPLEFCFNCTILSMNEAMLHSLLIIISYLTTLR